MKDSTKYLLIGGAALAVTGFVVYQVAKQNAQAKQPSGLSSIVKGLSDLYGKYSSGDSSSTSTSSTSTSSWSGPPGGDGKTAVYRTTGTTLSGGGTPYGPGFGDGSTSAVSDATGTRQTNQYVPGQATYLTQKQARLSGIYS